MLGIYMSGTGNTKHCITKFLGLIDPEADIIRMTKANEKKILDKLKENDKIVLAYPTQFSNAPYMVRDFIKRNKTIWAGKKVLCMTTMGAFSGDGAGCSARLLKKYGAEITGGIQVRMPDAVCDNKMLKKTLEENRKLVREADQKIETVARDILDNGKYPREGIGFISYMAGLFGQRLWFYSKTTDYSKKLKISDACIGCGLCSKNCPMENLRIKDGKAAAGDRCAMCYSCISTCPKQAITLLGSKVYEQCRYEKYKG